jgi:type II secretory pathway component PulF
MQTKTRPQPALSLPTVIVGSILLSICASIFVPLPSVIGQFAQLFSGFGADLPLLTRWVVAGVTFIWIAVLGTVVAQLVLFIVYISARSRKVKSAFWILAFVNLAALVTIVVAMYLPIFRLGSVV